MKIYLTEPGFDLGDLWAFARRADMTTDNERIHGSRHQNTCAVLEFNGYGAETHSARRPNTRDSGIREVEYAATWDQWGVLLSNILLADPCAKVGGYKHPVYDGADDFHKQTGDRFKRVFTLDQLPDFHGDHRFKAAPWLGSADEHVSKCVRCSAVSIR